MGTYDFDEIVERHGWNSYKWESPDPEVIPMWVADMDFRTAPGIIEALKKRVDHGIFGYTRVPEEYYAALTGWYAERHGFRIEKDWVLCTTGVVPALSAIIMALTEPGDKVIIQEPVYNCFFSSIRNMRCQTVSNDLIYRDGEYSIDFDDLERKAADPKSKLLLLCSPHNPAGRVWTREELERIGTICLQHNVMVVSDEIHCDLVYPGHTHIPFGSLSADFLRNSVTCIAPSKTFNLAGVQVANIVAADPSVNAKIDKALNINEVCELNAFAVEALTAAYRTGADWLEELKVYLRGNYEYLRGYFAAHLPGLTVLPLEATYLVWVDCKSLGIPSAEIARKIMEVGRVWINEGTMYGAHGEGFIRINIACPRAQMIRGLEGIKKAIG